MIWIVAGAFAWVAIAIPVGIALGRMMAEADRQQATGALPVLRLVQDCG